VSTKTIIVVTLAVVCGLSAAWGMSQLRLSSAVEAQIETAPIVRAAVQIPRGRMVTADDIEICQWPENMLPEGALTKLEDALDRAAMAPIMAGEPVLDAKLAAIDAGRGLAALIPKGMRAYTIQASQVAANVAGFILPGNRVDVLLTLKGRHNDETGGGSTTTLLQAVEILAVDQQLEAPADNKVDPAGLRSITLLVTPKQASLLDLGQHMGQLTLSLRNPEDGDEAATDPATLSQIRFRQEKPVAAAAEPASSQGSLSIVGRERAPEIFRILTLRGDHRGQVLISSGQ